ncbi:MAG: hypothetical protein FD130_2450 [Halothiobacillaceae bacterium]|nr:MAG: hypothetical protein FD130_2450 [Halothiobacillaceae bacterium]
MATPATPITTNRVRSLQLFVCVLLIPIIPFLIIGELPGEHWLSTTDTDSLLFGLTGAALLASDILLPIPSSILGTLLGAKLGLFSGWFWGCAGLVVGNLIGYLVGRAWPERLKVKLPATPTLLLLFVSRPVPILAEAVAIAAGASRMPLKSFLLTTLVGNSCYALALAANGAALLSGSLWIGPGLAIPMLLPVIAWFGWRWDSGGMR